MLNNALTAVCLGASGEAIAAARAGGLDPEQFVKAILASSARNVMLEWTWPNLLRPYQGPVPPAHTLHEYREFTRLALEVAAERGYPQSVVAAADAIYQRGIAAGLGEAHLTAFMRLYEGLGP
jgi:3-hydroxyisobutyrate dehydrogenase-like beta-hydroxyacid dehydrogenase